MQFPQTFVPTAHEVGLLAMVTEMFITIAFFGFAAATVFFLTTRNSVAPWHRSSSSLTAVICFTACVAYGFIRFYYHDMLHQIASIRAEDPVARLRVIHDAFFALGQYRYVDWSVTTPLLLLKMVLILKVKPREIMGWIVLLLGADFWMIFAGSIGDQQFSAVDGSLLVGRHLLWGTLSTVGYLVIPYVLFVRLGPRYGGKADDDSGWAFRLMAYSTVTTWGVYPLGYLVPAIFPHANMNWVHLAYTVADLINKVGVGVVAYLAGTEELERRVPRESVQHARIVS